ncbi:MAG: hypothetical protein M1497_07630 [Nitrospirae bacterium]|nr:hypothetical protein [Nitrospirota bacterium]
MDRVSLLCSTHSEMMHEFSRRCIRRLNGHGMLSLLLSPFQHFLEENVLKEIEKDALIIRHAARSFEAGSEAGIEEIFEETKDVDKAFLEKLPLPFRVNALHDDIEEIRKRRIEALAGFVTELLKDPEEFRSFADLARKTYPESRFREVIGGIFHLYNLETRMVSNSVVLPAPARIAKNRLAKTLFAEMEEAAKEVTEEYVNSVYGSGAPHAST